MIEKKLNFCSFLGTPRLYRHEPYNLGLAFHRGAREAIPEPLKSSKIELSPKRNAHFQNSMQNQSVNKNKINFVEFRRALGAASVSEVNASVWKDAPKPMLGLILHCIYSEFVRSSKIEKNMQKCDVAVLSVSCRRELDSGKSEFCRRKARLFFAWYLQ